MARYQEVAAIGEQLSDRGEQAIASAMVAKLWPVTPTARGLGPALAGLGSRDGFYAMLVLFIAARALFPPALPVLMIIVALGSHTYWLTRAIYSFASEGASTAPSDASPE